MLKYPLLDLPPWTDPTTLNSSLVGNITSNSNSISNVTGNSALALADLQPLNFSGSLLQGGFPNAVGTSIGVFVLTGFRHCLQVTEKCTCTRSKKGRKSLPLCAHQASAPIFITITLFVNPSLATPAST